MPNRDIAPLIAALAEEYARRSPRSAELHQRAKQVLVDGGSHTLRLLEPFPPRVVNAQGAWLRDEDGHRILDFWQGHFANLLGHNPAPVVTELARALMAGTGLQTGFADRLQVEVAELLCRRTGAERVRFTTSGTLATMYAVLLARAFTGRELVLKAGGGWHGAQPWALKGISLRPRADGSRVAVESAGLPAAVADEVLVTRYNDPQALEDAFRQHGDRIACFIVEPFIGEGGFMLATPEYLRTARALTEQYGGLLILDEVIAGFRFRAGDLGALYGVRPDLAAFGKIIGGGMPVAAVAGRADVLGLVARGSGRQVRFSGGTYSAHPASMLAAKTMLTYLVTHEAEIYPRLAALGEQTRAAVEAAFAAEGLPARLGGGPNEVVAGSSMFRVLFPRRPGYLPRYPDEIADPAVCDVELAGAPLQLALLLEDVHVMQGRGALSAAHTSADIEFLAQACRGAVRRLRQGLGD